MTGIETIVIVGLGIWWYHNAQKQKASEHKQEVEQREREAYMDKHGVPWGPKGPSAGHRRMVDNAAPFCADAAEEQRLIADWDDANPGATK